METRTHLFLALLSIAFAVDWVVAIKVSFNAEPVSQLETNNTAPESPIPRPRRLIAPIPNYQYFLYNGIHRYPQVPFLPQARGPPRLPLLLSLAPVLTPTYARYVPPTTTTPAPTPKPALVVKQTTAKGAPGRPGVDYPTYNTIPPTVFDCKTQRYKGFFADPDTECQVWHYCDLNGGQASFLCPNGTIFSQVLLTCDWWFNVRCNSTLQAYVLNERLYKFITPHKPTFPEDFSGPQVDEYLVEKQGELRAKELAKFERLKNKHKHNEFEDVDELQALLNKMRGH